MRRFTYALAAAVVLFGGITAFLYLNRVPAPSAPLTPAGPEIPATPGGEPARGRMAQQPSPPDHSGKEARTTSTSEADGTRGTDPADAHREETHLEAAHLPLSPGGATLTFQLQDSSHEPLSGTTIVLESGRERETQITGGDGHAVFGSIQGGVYGYRVIQQGVPELVSAREVTLSPDEEKELLLQIGSFDLSIAGRVRSRSGEAVPDVSVVARQQLAEVGEGTLVLAQQESLRAVSGPDGSYRIERLTEADYVLSTESSGGFPSVRKVYRAGIQTADLIMDAAREIEVHGTVTSRDMKTLEGVLIAAVGPTGHQARSDAKGRYSTRLQLVEGQVAYVLTASLAGYQDTRMNLRADQISDAESWEADIVLEPLGIQATVVGILTDSERNAVEGETVYLQSPSLNARAQATSGPGGKFSLGEVPVGHDYRLLVYPRRSHGGTWLKDYSELPVMVPEEGLELEITLERVEAGSVRGVMVDSAGNPIPRFTLWLRSMSTLGNSMSVTGDASGRFVAESVPAGEMLLETRSLPRLSVRGIEIEAGKEKETRIVLDWGNHVVEGTVLKEDGTPAAGASVTMSWSYAQADLQSASVRNALADAAGRFVFSELGPGEHRIAAKSAGYVETQTTYDVGSGAPSPVVRLHRQEGNRKAGP